jgi:hypothetical protein
MRKADTRQSKTEIGITSIGRIESGALCSDRREEKSGRRNELKKRAMTSSNWAAAKMNRQGKGTGISEVGNRIGMSKIRPPEEVVG